MIDVLIPEQASTAAGQVDLLFLTLIALSGFFIVLIFSLLIYFGIKYRRGSSADRTAPPATSIRLELFWTLGPLLLGLPVFVWAASVYLDNSVPPHDALEINVVGKQWMWHIQHPDGRREIDELHVPVNQPVKLQMISQDVIHSFWIPDFRLKQDVLPGRYTTLWFEATQTGTFPLKCAEFCGTHHSFMVGRVIVMEPAEYQTWLGGEAQGETLAAQGEQLFARLGCSSCHEPDPEQDGRGPSLLGLYGDEVELQDGTTLVADADYIRRSILEPQEQIVAGYQPIMPSFAGQVDEADLLALISYIQSLSDETEE
ncbi:MAG: cytochrome c oxidase subunit II [Anaerolineaceae bacterium]|nr:cytochrome c oxidase subunit II [Anaerolineaceae bacterium]